MFDEFTKYLNEISKKGFKEATNEITKYIDELDDTKFLAVVRNIGTIPESISHDSTEEKLYSKASDIVLARCFRLLGLDAKALNERADNADILASSTKGYNYSLVADAKCFRLSRTARNQKDFKISNLSDWRGEENEYAVLVAPYYQYPSKKSQIYSKALEENVCLMAWEHILLLLENNVKESESFCLESLWNASNMMARDKHLAFSNRQDCFLPKMDRLVAKKIGIDEKTYSASFSKYKKDIIERGKAEIDFWKIQIDIIKKYTKQKAIDELIKSQKLNEKINVISGYVVKLEK